MQTVPPLSMGLILVPAMTLALALAPLSAVHAENKAVIVSTASVNGETISCGCKKKDLGGIARRATLINEARANHPSAILVDAGNFGSQDDFKPWMRTEFQWEMMAKLKYDVITPGPSEMIKGIDALKSLLSQAPQIQVVSANITDKNGNTLFSPYAIVDKGGVTYGVTGVTDASYYSFHVSRGKAEVDEFDFLDVRESLQAVIPGLQEKADVVVVLLHTGAGDAKRVVEKLQGADVVVVGNNPGYKFLPETNGEAIVVRAGNRGQYVSVLELTLNEENAVVDHSGEALPLGEGVLVDKVYDPIVTQFNKKYDSMKKASAAKE